MQPKTTKNQFTPKWRHFHPQATLWVQNPLGHDVVFQVADEYNVPYQYRMRAGKVSELPGGAVATLGVKAIVDELIQNNAKDVFLMWDEKTRRKYEDDIILRMKEAPTTQEVSRGGEVDLTTSSNSADEEVAEPEDEEEVAFEDEPEATPVDEPEDEDFADAVPVKEPVVGGAVLTPNEEVANIAEASLAGKTDTILTEN